jgi:hypothetical protein
MKITAIPGETVHVDDLVQICRDDEGAVVECGSNRDTAIWRHVRVHPARQSIPYRMVLACGIKARSMRCHRRIGSVYGLSRWT